jgi:hypothetical protein
VNKHPQDIPLLLGLYEGVIKKSAGDRKAGHLTAYMYLLERIGQPKETLKVFPQILELSPQSYDLHFRFINQILIYGEAWLAFTELCRLEARLKLKFQEKKQLTSTVIENQKLQEKLEEMRGKIGI